MGGWGSVTPRRAAAGIALAGALLSLVAAPACGSDCTETLTCADQPGDDASPPEASGDRSLSDRSTGDVRGGDTVGSDASKGDVTMPPPDACDAAAVENCTNNFDDNCDGKIDCADPTCSQQGFRCIPAAPNGWTGPAAYYSGAAAAPACPSAYPTDAIDGNSDPSQTPATCTCNCGAPQGVSCSPVTLTYFVDNVCSQLCSTDSLPGNVCVPASCLKALSATASPPQPQGGSCAPSAGTNVPPVQWSDAERACTGPVGGGCAAGQVCAAPVGNPFGATQCVAMAGQQSCPAQYPNGAPTTYGGANDSRGCSQCTCGSPGGLTCSQPTVTLWTDAQCTQLQYTSFAADGACQASGGGDMGGPLGAASTVSSLQGSGSCTQGGGTPQGTVTPTMPTTVCCL